MKKGNAYYSRSCPECGEPKVNGSISMNKVEKPKHGDTTRNCKVLCGKCRKPLARS